MGFDQIRLEPERNSKFVYSLFTASLFLIRIAQIIMRHRISRVKHQHGLIFFNGLIDAALLSVSNSEEKMDLGIAGIKLYGLPVFFDGLIDTALLRKSICKVITNIHICRLTG